MFHVKHLYEKGTVLLYHTPVGKNRRQKEFSHGKIMIFREELPKKQEPRQKSSPACLFLNIFSQKSAPSLPEIGRSDCFFSSRDLTGKFNIRREEPTSTLQKRLTKRRAKQSGKGHRKKRREEPYCYFKARGLPETNKRRRDRKVPPVIRAFSHLPRQKREKTRSMISSEVTPPVISASASHAD